MKNVTFKFSNWFKNTTPKIIQIIGDIGLLAASISGFLLGLQQIVPKNIWLGSVINGDTFDQVNVTCLAVGVLVKFISKFFQNKR